MNWMGADETAGFGTRMDGMDEMKGRIGLEAGLKNDLFGGRPGGL
jgi:hypothetical protein